MAGAPVGSLRVDLSANTASYEQGMRRAASVTESFQKGMGGATAVSRQYRAGMQQLGFQINDVAAQMAVGTRATVIFAQQSSQFIQAIQLMSGGTSRFAAFMGSGWGIALAAGSVVLAPLIAKLFDTRTELQKATDELAENARKADITRQAQELFGRTLPGVEAAIRAETTALQQQNTTLRENQQLVVAAAQQRVARLEELRNTNLRAQADAIAAVTAAETELARAQASAGDRGSQRLAAAHQALEVARTRLAATRAENARINADLAQQEANIREAQIPVVDAEVQGRLSRVVDATQRLADAEARLRTEYRINRAMTREIYEERLLQIRRVGQAQIRAAEEAERAARRTDRSLVRPVTGAVVSQFGSDRSDVPINGRRIPGRRHQGVDLRGNRGDPVVAPESGVARVLNAPGGLGLYVEIRADSGARDLLAHLSAANIRSGQRVEAGQIVGLVGSSGNAVGGAPHLHWQRQVGGRWVDPMRAVGSSGAAQEAQTAAREAEQLAERRRRDEERYQEQLAGLNTDILNARRRQVQTEEEAAADDIAAIQAEQAERDQRIRNEAAERIRRDSTQAQTINAETGILLARSQELAQAKISARRGIMQQRLDEQRIDIAQRDLNDQESVLQARSQLARTAIERRDIELRLLALQHQEELLAIQKQRTQANLSAAQRAQLDRQESAVNARYGLNRQNVLRGSMGPLESFINDLPQTAAQIRESLQSIAVEGLQSITDGLVDVMTGARKMGDVFRSVVTSIISDLLRIQIQKAIIGPLANMLGGLLGGAGGAGKAFGDVTAFMNLPGRAAGGPVLPGRMYMVGEKGPELLRMGSSAGTVIANDNIGSAVNIYQTVQFEGVAVTQQEFMQGLAATKNATVQAIHQARRRSA